jgi:endonuclease/exonuclease/phosphatase family metal-dependent hydrolase
MRFAGTRFASFAVFLAILAAGAVARAETPVRMRVVTWNVWGVPLITSRLDERLAEIPDAVAALEPDLVCFQELWEARHAESVARELALRGLGHSRRFEGPGGRTGLFVASKWPLRGGSFRPFSIGRMPHSLWHLDWMVEKGVADVTVQTPAGDLRLENTHFQAQYRTDEYGAERLAQAVELVLAGRNRTHEALLVAGDFNGRGDELPRRALRDLGGFDDASPASNQDSVYARGGRDLSVRIVGARNALGEAVRPRDGEMLALSDHVPVVVDVELTRCSGCERSRRVVSATRSAAIASLERAAGATPLRVTLALLTAHALLVLGVAFKRRVGVVARGSRSQIALRVLGLAAIAAGFVWCSYLGAVYYPTRATKLRAIAAELSRIES